MARSNWFWAMTLAVFGGVCGDKLAMGEDDILARELKNAVKSAQAAVDHNLNVIVNLEDELADSDYRLGVQVSAVPEIAKKQLAVEDGLAVDEVTPESPAAKAEIKKHDILVKVGSTPLKRAADLVKALEASQGSEITIVMIRDGEQRIVKVVPDKRPTADGAAEAVKKALQAKNPELAGEIKQLEAALEKLKSKVGKDGVGFWFAGPGVVAPQVEYKLNGAALQAKFPKDLSVQIQKEGNQPAKIHVKQGDQEWNVTEGKLGELPDNVRPHVERYLAPARASIDMRKVRVSPDGKVQGEVRIAPTPPIGPTIPAPPVRPAPPYGAIPVAPVKPPAAPQAARTYAFRSGGESDAKLDAILKKLDKLESGTLSKLDKEVKQLRQEFDELRTKSPGDKK
jgi:hypothetical protein